jgi:hypothetical protein
MNGPKSKSGKAKNDRPSRISRSRIEAMIAEATVDCYNDSEQSGGLFNMMEGNLVIPFKTSVLGVDVIVEKLDISPADEIVAVCRRDRHRMRIPILDLPLPQKRPAGAEWIEAYRYWSR